VEQSEFTSGRDIYTLSVSPLNDVPLSSHTDLYCIALKRALTSDTLLLSLNLLKSIPGLREKITIIASIARMAMTIINSTRVNDLLTTVEYCDFVTIPRGHHVKFLTLPKLKVFHCDDFCKFVFRIGILFRILGY
jgi:hypothetical protein